MVVVGLDCAEWSTDRFKIVDEAGWPLASAVSLPVQRMLYVYVCKCGMGLRLPAGTGRRLHKVTSETRVCRCHCTCSKCTVCSLEVRASPTPAWILLVLLHSTTADSRYFVEDTYQLGWVGWLMLFCLPSSTPMSGPSSGCVFAGSAILIELFVYLSMSI